MLAVLLSLSLTACAQHDQDMLPGTVERDRVELAAEADEFIVKLPFAEGSQVKAGDVIVVQDGAISAAELDAARAAGRSRGTGRGAAERPARRAPSRPGDSTLR